MIDQKAFRGMLWVSFGMEQFVRRMGTFHLKSVGQISFGKMRKKKGKPGKKEIGNRSRRTRSWGLSDTAVTCALKVY